MERVELRPDPLVDEPHCWHCGRAVTGKREARYLYRGQRPRTAIVEDWHRCACGAYQNVRRSTAITVSVVERT